VPARGGKREGSGRGRRLGEATSKKGGDWGTPQRGGLLHLLTKAAKSPAIKMEGRRKKEEWMLGKGGRKI